MKKLLIRVAAGLLMLPVVALWGIVLLLCAPMFGLFALITSRWEMSVAWVELKEVYGEMSGYTKWQERTKEKKLAAMDIYARINHHLDQL